MMRHGRRGDADPRRSTTRDRRRAGHARDPEGVPRHRARQSERWAQWLEYAAPRPAPRRGVTAADTARSRSRGRSSTSARRSSCSRCCAPGGSRSGRRSTASRSCSPSASGAPYAAAVSSGTAGLHLLCRLAGVGPGDEVITSPFSFVASANCFIFEGATPVFADVDPRDAQPRPGRGRGGDHASGRRRSSRSTSSATRASSTSCARSPSGTGSR